jgi:hypothetical protein
MLISAAASIIIKSQRRPLLRLPYYSTLFNRRAFLPSPFRTYSANNDEGKQSTGSMFSNRLKELRKSIKATDVDPNAERLPPTSDTGQFDLFGQARG